MNEQKQLHELLDEKSVYGVTNREIIRELLRTGVLKRLASSSAISPRAWANEPEAQNNYDLAMKDFIFLITKIANGNGGKITTDNQKA